MPSSALTDTTTTCGQGSHDPSCTCDVVIDRPVNAMPNLNLLDIWQARFIAKQMNYTGADESDARTYEFLEMFVTMYDQTKVAREMRDDLQGDAADAASNRELICNLLRDGYSMIEIPAALAEFDGGDWCLPVVVQTLTTNQPSKVWRWTAEDWLYAETLLVSAQGKHSCTSLGKLLGIAKSTVEVIAKWYGVKPYLESNKGNRHDAAAKERRAILQGWFDADSELTPVAAHSSLVAAGHAASYQSVCNMLNRIRKAAA